MHLQDILNAIKKLAHPSKKIHDDIRATGSLCIELRGPDGQLKDRREINNLVVTVGKGFIASRMVGTAAAIMSHMGIGSGTVAAAAGDAALGTQLARVALTSGTAAAAVATFVASFAAGVGTGSVTEAGIFNDAAAGTMLARTVFGVITKGADDSMSVTWQVTVS